MADEASVLTQLRALLAKAQPRPWFWNVNLKSRTMSLEGRGRGGMRETVMAFTRWGMAGAQPQFNRDGLLVRASDETAAVPGREHHRDWFRTLTHPDAQLIVAAVNALPALLDVVEAAGKLTSHYKRYEYKPGVWLIDMITEDQQDDDLEALIIALGSLERAALGAPPAAGEGGRHDGLA